ncbi:hypothetical protein [Jonesia quinghaiensis]|nr:hypothetical protein [Jonesia quinghaiensis]
MLAILGGIPRFSQERYDTLSFSLTHLTAGTSASQLTLGNTALPALIP